MSVDQEDEPPYHAGRGRPVRACLYDADGLDTEVELDRTVLDEIDDGHLLWIDAGLDDVVLAELGDRLDLGTKLEELDLQPGRRARIEDHGSFFHARVHAFRPGADDFATTEIHCLVGRTWIATLHRADVDLIKVFNQPIAANSDIGHLDGPAFFAHLVDWQLRGFFHADEQLDERIDWIDDQLLGTDDEGDDDLLDDLIELRRVNGKLRRTITPHRDVLAVLAQPDLAELTDPATAERFGRLAERLERVIDAIEGTRGMVTDSLDILMTKAAQRTNDTMKILTVVSILLLPAVVVAGVMGMNFQVGFFQEPRNFWFVLAAMAALAIVTALVARLRRWL